MILMPRDIELMLWIQEQKFMTARQIRRAFWKGVVENNTETHRRLHALEKAGFLKKNKSNIYSYALYLITKSGIRHVKALRQNLGLGELYDVDYSMVIHDMTVTDIRILFHEWGYGDWVCERVLCKWHDFRQLADGMVYHHGRFFAIEYEASQKGRRRYKEIFLHYKLDREVKGTFEWDR